MTPYCSNNGIDFLKVQIWHYQSILTRMIKPFFGFLLLFLAIVINFQGSSKTYLAETYDERNMNQDYSRRSKEGLGKKICQFIHF